VLLTTWPPYCLLGAGIVGLWLMQSAFSAGPLHSSLPAIAAGEPVAGIALGIVVFGDRIQISPGMLAIEAGGIAALIVGVVAVARSSAFGGLRKIPRPHVITPHTTPAEAPARGPDASTSRREDSAHRREDSARRRSELNGLRQDPKLDEAGQLDASGPRQAHRRPFHGPASGEEGG
jgi:hypothetical protein